MPDNTITIVGTCGRDPELRFTPGGQAKAEWSMAINRSWTDKQTNEKKEVTSWFNVVAWGQLGENAAASLTKGSRAIVTGRLEQRTYETQTGEKRERIEIVADEVGPSLRWATAQVERNDRKGAGDYQSAGRGSSSPAFEDEEPF